MADDQKPQADEPEKPEADVEGHSLSIVMGLDSLNRSARRRAEAGKRDDDSLPRLTKPFPRMRDQKRG
jgi:hypothetical protein